MKNCHKLIFVLTLILYNLVILVNYFYYREKQSSFENFADTYPYNFKKGWEHKDLIIHPNCFYCAPSDSNCFPSHLDMCTPAGNLLSKVDNTNYSLWQGEERALFYNVLKSVPVESCDFLINDNLNKIGKSRCLETFLIKTTLERCVVYRENKRSCDYETQNIGIFALLKNEHNFMVINPIKYFKNEKSANIFIYENKIKWLLNNKRDNKYEDSK